MPPTNLPGLISNMKGLLTAAVKATFDADYVEPDFRNLYVSVEFPADEANYPGIWVDFEPVGPLSNVGIGHVEYRLNPDTDKFHKIKRWRFGGMATYTLVALSSVERDRLVDEMVRAIAFPDESPQVAGFRAKIESSDLIAIDMKWDEINIRGMAATPGTPWGTDDIIYEATLAIETVGEFFSNPSTGEFMALSEIRLYGYTADEGDPTSVSVDPAAWVSG